MKIKQVKCYELSELSEEAQEKAHENYLTSSNFEWDSAEELKETLRAFENVFPVKIKDYSFDNNYADVTWEMYLDWSEVEEFTGIRLMKYLINNYYNYLFKPKFIGSINGDHYVEHKRIKSQREPYENGRRYQPYYSAIQKTTECVLTGMCFDDGILEPVYKFLKNPTENGSTFSDLMQECFWAWETMAKNELQSQLEFEYFQNTSEANSWEFDENGERL